jgi:amino acid permease
LCITKKKIHHDASARAGAGISQSKRSKHAGEFQMNKTFNITLAFLLFAPIAVAIAMQAARIVA